MCVPRYPLSVTGIDFCAVMYDWLKTGSLDSYLISTCSQWPPPTSLFMEMTCELETLYQLVSDFIM